jgi:predicted transcriptional regulator
VDEEAVVARLDTISRLLALNLVEGKKQVDQIVLLTKAGWRPKDVAELLGTSSNAVSVALSQLRKRGALKIPATPE